MYARVYLLYILRTIQYITYTLYTHVYYTHYVGKADTMTTKERNRFISLVKDVFEAITQKFGDPCIYDFNG